MGSFGDESYTPRRAPRSTPIFKPESKKTEPEPPPTKKTGRATSIKPPVTTAITRPTGKINIILSFDVTDSMGSYRENLKEKAEYLYEEITKLLPELAGDMQMSFVGIGDHCDGKYMYQPTAFSDDVAVLQEHVESIKDTNGGDAPEAFECLFKNMNAWDIDGTNTILILVTDSIPHGMGSDGDDGCPSGVDWETELQTLKKKLRAFYLMSCTSYMSIKRLQRRMVDKEEYFIELGGNATRLTNTVHAIIAKELGEIDKYLGHLTQTRGSARAEEVKTLLKTKTTK